MQTTPAAIRLPAVQTVDNVQKSLAEFAPTGANRVKIHFGPEFISGPKYCSRSALSSSLGSLLRFTPKGQSSDIRLLLLSKRKQCFRLEKEEGNERVEFSPHGGNGTERFFF